MHDITGKDNIWSFYWWKLRVWRTSPFRNFQIWRVDQLFVKDFSDSMSEKIDSTYLILRRIFMEIQVQQARYLTFWIQLSNLDHPSWIRRNIGFCWSESSTCVDAMLPAHRMTQGLFPDRVKVTPIEFSLIRLGRIFYKFVEAKFGLWRIFWHKFHFNTLPGSVLTLSEETRCMMFSGDVFVDKNYGRTRAVRLNLVSCMRLKHLCYSKIIRKNFLKIGNLTLCHR